MTPTNATFYPLNFPPLVRNIGAAMLLCMCIFACYSNTLQNGFVSDDYFNIELNHADQSLKSAFIRPNGLFENEQLPYYRPLSGLFFLVAVHFFGVNPVGYHVVNIVLHMLLTVLFYFTLLKLGGRQSLSLWIALLFGIHPIHAETVNFISNMSNLLSAVFALMSLLAFLYAERHEKHSIYLLSATFFFLGLLCKETVAMLFPFFIVIKVGQEIIKHNIRTMLKWNMSYILYHVLFLTAYLSLRFVAIGNNYVDHNMPGLAARAEQLLYIIPTYFSLLVMPVKLAFPHIVPSSFSDRLLPLTLGWVAVILSTVYILRKRNDTTLFWFVWVIVNFIPISNVVPIPSYPLAERYLYLPAIGLFALVGDALYGFTERIGTKKLVVLAFTGLLVVFGIRTFMRNFDWKDDLSLSLKAVNVYPASASNHYFLGMELYLRNRSTEAKQEFEEAIKLDPGFPYASCAYYYLGTLHREARHFAESKRCFMESAQSGNQAARFIISSLYPGERTSRKNEGLLPMTYPEFLFIPEMNDRMHLLNLDRKLHTKNLQSRSRQTSDALQSEQWQLFHRFSTGTELYFDPAAVRKEKTYYVTIIMRQLLAPSDRRSFAFRIIRLPLAQVVDARFVITVNCSQKVYMTRYMDFRDAEGTVLGKVYPEKADDAMYEYLLPGSTMRSLAEKVCWNQFH